MDTAIPASPPTDANSKPPDAATPRLELHIPAHHPAPGERPDFSYVPRFPAGSVERPGIDAAARDHDLTITSAYQTWAAAHGELLSGH